MNSYEIFALHAVGRNREVRRLQRLYREVERVWKPLVAQGIEDTRNQARYYRRLLCDPRSFGQPDLGLEPEPTEPTRPKRMSDYGGWLLLGAVVLVAWAFFL
jgi:hypothetical protein